MTISGFGWASVDELRARTSVKWRAYSDDVLPLWVAEMDVEMAPAVREALLAAIARGDTGYPAGHPYAEALGGFAAERWAWDDFSVARTSIVPDVMLGIVEVLRLITVSGDAVVVTPPVYPPFYAFTSSAGRQIVEAPLGPDSRLDLAALDEAFKRARTTSANPVFLMSNPHNPTGVAHTRTELEGVAALARQHGVRVIADEIHAPLVLAGSTFTPYLTVAGAEADFALMSASKGWNLAGLKAALVVAGTDAVDDLRRMPEEVSHGPSHLGVIAHTAALNDRSGWIDDLLSALSVNRALVTDLVADELSGVMFTPPEATYLAWLDCRALGLGDDEPASESRVVSDLAGPAKFFLDKARVALSSGHVFGSGGDGWVRLNFATSPAIITEAIDCMESALAAR